MNRANAAEPWHPGFARRDAGELCCDDVPLAALAARFGTPLYVYSATAVRAQAERLQAAFAPLGAELHYAVKANDNLGLMALLAELGFGFDIVSGGELARVQAIGADPARVVFSGVGKRDDELRAALTAGVGTINLESEAEAARVATVAAELGTVAPVAVRLNPDVDPQTHPYIATGLKSAKFGVEVERTRALVERLVAEPALRLRGLAFHIGSQLLDTGPILAALDRTLRLVDELAAAGIRIETLDLGGGLGIRYRREDAKLDVAALAAGLRERLAGRQLRLALEPGRFLVGNAGALLTRVLYPKLNGGVRYAVVDASMSELLRPALYAAHHEVEPVAAPGEGTTAAVTLVGPVCESADVLARDRHLPVLGTGDLVALMSAGAYGSTMANTYNTRPRPAEVLVDGDRVRVLRRRETMAEVLGRDERAATWEILP